MKIEISGFTLPNGEYHDFLETLETTTNDAAGIHELIKRVEANGVCITAMRNMQNGERYFTKDEAPNCDATFGASKEWIWVFTSDGAHLHFDRITK